MHFAIAKSFRIHQPQASEWEEFNLPLDTIYRSLCRQNQQKGDNTETKKMLTRISNKKTVYEWNSQFANNRI